ncbi:pilus assembly FimT family protein [Psychrobacter sp. I-STPA10]|uniref:pilus assembly FimT family protein n=1 Tax=Psychrobacter sp. I-STPA10 TaxID=2585769 RepID=UPI001E414E26|nr:prepilin-type N-terminal cleavage/methylation domain-containing protein [Psychrobacter sp. I-STPA10]
MPNRPLTVLKKNNVKQQGFTLVEMLVTIAVMAIIVAIAAPSMSRQLADQRIRTTAATLDNALSTAKAESLIRKQKVKVSITGTTIQVVPLKADGSDDTANKIAEYKVNSQISPTTTITFNPYRQVTATCYNITDDNGSARQVQVDATVNISIKSAGSC